MAPFRGKRDREQIELALDALADSRAMCDALSNVADALKGDCERTLKMVEVVEDALTEGDVEGAIEALDRAQGEVRLTEAVIKAQMRYVRDYDSHLTRAGNVLRPLLGR